jgi:23S rRNA pseudouridine1911/1915/1917 synthase
VHLTAAGHPLVGDPAYGGGASRVPRGTAFFPAGVARVSAWHLIHPQTGSAVFWKSSLPQDLAELLETMRQEVLSLRCRAADEEDDDGLG